MPVHPAIAAKFHLLDGIESFEDAMNDPEQRARLEEFMSIPGDPPPDAEVHDETAPGPHGPVPVRVYRPTGTRADDGATRPALVWMHGGAFLGGDLDMPEADWTARQVCDRAGAAVVSVDYRLAVGGMTYPVPHDDVVAAIRWVRKSAADLGLDPGRISVGGASAGANLAAGAALRLRDDDAWQPRCLLLAYPVAHPVIPPASDALAARMRDIPAVLRFLPHQTEFITTNYLGGPRSRADGYAMPALAVLDGLCPTVVLNAEYDDLRASGEHFTAALAVAGVDVRQWMAPGMLHGFLNTRPDLAAIDTALTLLAEAVAGPAASPWQPDPTEVAA